jgi:predicted acyltransferase
VTGPGAGASRPAVAGRDRTLDALRGLALAAMALVNAAAALRGAPAVLAHAAWDGLRPADAVFPLFLYVAGGALARATGPGLHRPLPWRRAAGLIVVGLVLGALPFGEFRDDGAWQWLVPSAVRLPGVLQRIAVATLAAAAIWRAGRRAGLAFVALTLIAYPLVLAAGGDATPAGNLAGAIDRAVFGVSHLLGEGGVPFDPEGLLTTWPATATVLIGALATGPTCTPVVTASLLRGALGLAVLGLGLMPLVAPNKALWSSSFVLLTGSLSMFAHALVALARCGPGGGAVVSLLAAAGRRSLVLYAGSEALLALLNAVPVGADTLLEALCAALFASWAGAAAGSTLFAISWAALLLAAGRLAPPARRAAAAGRFGDNGA